MSRHDVYAHHEETDDWVPISYRDSLWTDDGRVTGDVSANEDWYNIIQYGDILETVGDGIRRRGDDFEVAGEVALSPTAHKMTADIDFEGEETTVYAAENDPVNLGLKIRSGHSGFHALKYDVGGERQVCSNGMMGFVSDLHFEQYHSEPFRPGLAYNAVDAVFDSPETVEERIRDAQERELMNRDEALLVLMDLGIDHYLDDPVDDLVDSLEEEVSDPETPTLWETYGAATRALTHRTGNLPQYVLDTGFERAAELLETGYSSVPDPESLGRNAVESRVNRYLEEEDLDPYWDGERDTLDELLEAHRA